MEGKRRGAPGHDEDFTFVSGVIKYLLFIFNFIFWVSALAYFQFLLFALQTRFSVFAFVVLYMSAYIQLFTVCLSYPLTLVFCKR